MCEACRVGPEFTVTELWGSIGFYGSDVGLAERRLRSFESGFAGFRVQGSGRHTVRDVEDARLKVPAALV